MRPTILSDTTIALMRKRKLEGVGVNEIAREFGCASSTASFYCRDLFYNPHRKYQTEEEARLNNSINTVKAMYHQGIRQKRRYTHEKYLKKKKPCAQCGEPRKPKCKSGLCIRCYKQKRREDRLARIPPKLKNITQKHTPKHIISLPIKPFCSESPIDKHSCKSGWCLWCERVIIGGN